MMTFLKRLFVRDAILANIPEKEIDFRFSAFEAMSLAIHGKREEALIKLQEVDELYSKLDDNKN
jgi:hypothetical protein